MTRIITRDKHSDPAERGRAERRGGRRKMERRPRRPNYSFRLKLSVTINLTDVTFKERGTSKSHFKSSTWWLFIANQLCSTSWCDKAFSFNLNPSDQRVLIHIVLDSTDEYSNSLRWYSSRKFAISVKLEGNAGTLFTTGDRIRLAMLATRLMSLLAYLNWFVCCWGCCRFCANKAV